MFDQKGYVKQWGKDNRKKLREQLKQWRENNRDYYKKYRKKYNEENIERIKECNKHYYENNKEEIKEKVKQYCQDNLEKIKEYKKKWEKNKYKSNSKFNLNRKISTAIRLSLKGNKNGRHWGKIVGYTLNDLIKHLKKTIPIGYDWNDYLDGKLHIDHKIPISAHNFTKSEHIDFKRCWALTNLQLLPAKENIIKNAKLIKPFQPALKV